MPVFAACCYTINFLTFDLPDPTYLVKRHAERGATGTGQMGLCGHAGTPVAGPQCGHRQANEDAAKDGEYREDRECCLPAPLRVPGAWEGLGVVSSYKYY